MSLDTKCLLYTNIIHFHEWLNEDLSHTVLSLLPVTLVAMATTKVERERERSRPPSLWGIRRGREKVVCNSESCSSEAPAEAEETVVCKWKIYLYRIYEAPAQDEDTVVCNWDISSVSMTHQLRLRKQLFATQECYLYKISAESEETVVCNWEYFLYCLYEAPVKAEEIIVCNCQCYLYCLYDAPAEAEETVVCNSRVLSLLNTRRG